MINIIYRLSDNGYAKFKFPNATKIHCLENCITHFNIDHVHLFVDETNLQPKTKNEIEFINESRTFGKLTYYVGGSSAGSWRYVFDYAFENFKDDEFVYFVEDDYLHLPNSKKILLEGLSIADYVSLYDHNDKYIPSSLGGNMFVDEDGGEVTKVIRTENTHWKFTNSTTMTFATSIYQLKQDESIWRSFTQGSHPNDFACFLELRKIGRSLITPIPGYSTHCEPDWASPGIDWSKI